jgi:hypothetical protein
MTSPRSSLLVTAFAAVFAVAPAHAVEFKQIFPVLNQKCSECHSKAKKVKGKFDIGVPGDWTKQVNVAKPELSGIIHNVTSPDDDDDVMPPKGKNKMTAAEIGMLKQWISEGASFTPGGAKPAAPAAPAAAPAAAAGGAMNWTNASGKSIKAIFDRIEGDAVVLKVADGKYYSVPLAGLDAASQAQAKKAAGQ